MWDLLFIVPTGIIIGIILIYFKQQHTNKNYGRLNQRTSNKISNQDALKQSSNQQSLHSHVEQNIIPLEKQKQTRDPPQLGENQFKLQANSVKPRVQSLDQKQQKITNNKQDLGLLRSQFRDDKPQQQIHDFNKAILSDKETLKKSPQNFQQQQEGFKQADLRQNANHQVYAQGHNQQIQSNSSIVQQKIFKLYNISCRVRKSDALFLGPASISQNFSDYFIDNQVKQQLKLFLRGYRQVRGDGNCYFTAIAFQYFEILLNKFNYLEFNEFINQIQLMEFQIKYNGYYIEAALQKQFAIRMAQLLQMLRDNPTYLESIMADPNQEFYGLSIIFFRNLAQSLYQKQNSQIISEYRPDLSDELLTWEFQCNDSEMINSSLAKYLNIIINVYFIDQKNNEVTPLKYGQQSTNEIHLIYIPGHYDIGIPN